MKKRPHAYIHRSHTSGDPEHTKDAFIDSEKGIIFFKDGKTHKGKKLEVFENALVADKLGKLEAFAVLDKDEGLLISKGARHTSVAIHGHKHPEKQKVVYLSVPESSTEYHGFWEEDKESLHAHKIPENIDSWLHQERSNKKEEK